MGTLRNVVLSNSASEGLRIKDSLVTLEAVETIHNDKAGIVYYHGDGGPFGLDIKNVTKHESPAGKTTPAIELINGEWNTSSVKAEGMYHEELVGGKYCYFDKNEYSNYELALIELIEAKHNANIELNNYVNSDDYTENADELAQALAAGKSSIDEAMTPQEVAAALAAAKTAIRSKIPKILEIAKVDENTKVEAVNLENTINLPELNGDSVVKVRIVLKAEKAELNDAIKEKLQRALAVKNYSLLDVYNIELFKQITNYEGKVSESKINNEDINGNIKIRIPLNQEQAKKENLAVAYIDNQGNTTIIEGKIEKGNDGKYFVFETNHFSIYALVELNLTKAEVEELPKTGQKDEKVMILFLSLMMMATGVYLVKRNTKVKEKNLH